MKRVLCWFIRHRWTYATVVPVTVGTQQVPNPRRSRICARCGKHEEWLTTLPASAVTLGSAGTVSVSVIAAGGNGGSASITPREDNEQS